MAAGEALNPEVLRAFSEGTGLEIRDGYGQTETGQLTGDAGRRSGASGLDGPAAPGRRRSRSIDGELVLADPRTDPTFFVGYLDGPARPPSTSPGTPATGSTQDEDGYLYFEGRTDDVIISAGYRIGPFEVESALVSHAAVAEAAVVAAPDDERGAVVRAVVVLRDGFASPATSSPPSSRSTSSARPPVQIPPDRRFRARAAQDRERQGPARAATRRADRA